MDELVATVVNEKMRFMNEFNDTVILDSVHKDGDATLKGVADELGPHVGGTYRFHGKWSKYLNKRSGVWENQFHFRSFIPSEPKGEMAIVNYLCRCPFITRGMAEKLWDAFGEEAIVKLAEGDPLILTFARFTEGVLDEAIAWLDEEAAIRDSMIEVLALLDGRGLPKSIVLDAIRTYGARAAHVIRRNPYLLMEFRGCGFKRADKMYLDFGGNPRAMKRLIYAAEYAVEQWGGHTWNPLAAVEQELRTSVNMQIDMQRLRRIAARARKLAFTFTDGAEGPIDDFDGQFCWVTTRAKAAAERRVAERVKELMNDVGNNQSERSGSAG